MAGSESVEDVESFCIGTGVEEVGELVKDYNFFP
jgi:hypothetical protein